MELIALHFSRVLTPSSAENMAEDGRGNHQPIFTSPEVSMNGPQLTFLDEYNARIRVPGPFQLALGKCSYQYQTWKLTQR